MLNEDACCGTERQSISTLALEELSSATERVRESAEKISIRLARFLAESAPQTPSNEKQAEPDFPPYFNDIRDNTRSIDQSINILEDVLNRLKL